MTERRHPLTCVPWLAAAEANGAGVAGPAGRGAGRHLLRARAARGQGPL